MSIDLVSKNHQFDCPYRENLAKDLLELNVKCHSRIKKVIEELAMTKYTKTPTPEIWKNCSLECRRLISTYEQTLFEQNPKAWAESVPTIKKIKKGTLSEINDLEKETQLEETKALAAIFGVDFDETSRPLIDDPDDINSLYPLIQALANKSALTWEKLNIFIHQILSWPRYITETRLRNFLIVLETFSTFPEEAQDNFKRLYSKLMSIPLHLLWQEFHSLPDAISEAKRDQARALGKFKDRNADLLHNPSAEKALQIIQRESEALLEEISAEITEKLKLQQFNLPDKLQKKLSELITPENYQSIVGIINPIKEAFERKILSLKALAKIVEKRENLSYCAVSVDEAIHLIESLHPALSTNEIDRLCNLLFKKENIPFLKQLCARLELAKEIAQSKSTVSLQTLFRYLLNGGTAQKIIAFFDDWRGHQEPYERFLTLEGVAFIESLPDEDLKVLSQYNFLSFLYDTTSSLDQVRDLLSNKKKCDFFYNNHNTLSQEALSRIFELLNSSESSQGKISKEEFKEIRKSLSPEDYIRLLNALPQEDVEIKWLYEAEKTGNFEEAIHRLPLNKVPTEPLIRFFSSKPFEEISRWLEASIVTEKGLTKRIDTLDEHQKQTILRRFPRYASPLPQQRWMTLFGVDEETCWKFCTVQLQDASPACERWNAQMADVIDPMDPMSVFLAACPEQFFDRDQKTYRAIVAQLLRNAKEDSLCGARVVLRWANAPADTSVCSAQDGIPILSEKDGKKIPYYQKGLLNNPVISVPAFTLHRSLQALFKKTDFEDFVKGYAKESEEYLEVDRIAGFLQEDYPHLVDIQRQQGSFFSDQESSEEQSATEDEIETHESPMPPEGQLGTRVAVPPPLTQDLSTLSIEGMKLPIEAESLRKLFLQFKESSNEYQLSATLLELLQAMFVHITRSPAISATYNSRSRSHTAAICLICFMWMSRNSSVDMKPAQMTVQLSPLAKYILREYRGTSYEEKHEDNPWMEFHEFLNLCNDYPTHTPSPLTPNRNFPPSFFATLVKELKALDDSEFYTLCESVLNKVQNMEDSMAKEYVASINAELSSKKTLSKPAEDIITYFLDTYMSYVSEGIQLLEPSKTYSFNPRCLGRFSPAEEIPSFIRSEGNFASALCHFYTPIPTTRHEGNCCVESILNGLNGQQKYEGEKGKEALDEDINAFRAGVVEYGKAHEEALRYEFEDEEVDKFLQRYAADRTESTDTVALACIARKFGREIRVFSRPFSTFTTDSKGEIEPCSVFPAKGEETGAPINLMYWDGCHYCLLKRK